MQTPCRASLNPSSPPRSLEKGRAWDCLRFTESLSRVGVTSGFTASRSEEQRLRSTFLGVRKAPDPSSYLRGLPRWTADRRQSCWLKTKRSSAIWCAIFSKERDILSWRPKMGMKHYTFHRAIQDSSI